MTTPTVRAVQLYATLVCPHILDGEQPTGDATLRGEGLTWHYVRLCSTCYRLSKVPGGLRIMLPKAPKAPPTRTRTSLDHYIDQSQEGALK